MADAAQNQMVEIDPDFEPLSRPRSCTWPLPRPEFPNPAAADSNTSSPAPSVKQEPSSNTDFINNLSLLEENEDYPDQKPLMLCGDFQCQENCIHQQQIPSHPQQVPVLSSPVAAAAAAAAAAQRKSSSSRRNAWGNMSYADLITKAIESSPEKRLTLSQIYDWMVKSVPYFKDKGDSNSSAGWKVCMFSFLCTHASVRSFGFLRGHLFKTTFINASWSPWLPFGCAPLQLFRQQKRVLCERPPVMRTFGYWFFAMALLLGFRADLCASFTYSFRIVMGLSIVSIHCRVGQMIASHYRQHMVRWFSAVNSSSADPCHMTGPE